MQKENMKYGVYILKKDQEHILVEETDDFEKADKMWAELEERWTTSLTEKKPFKLRKPIVTAFDPGLIYEITIRPVMDNSKNSDNPYQERMRREGFSAALRGGSDVLDGGYK